MVKKRRAEEPAQPEREKEVNRLRSAWTCRRLGASDMAIAMRLNETIRPGLVTAEGGAAFLAQARNWLFVVLQGDTPIGFAYGCELQRPNGSKCLYIHEVGVAEPWQRQGVGTALLQALAAACRAFGIPKFFLWTDQANAGANALYRRMGGEVCPESQGNDRAYWFYTQETAADGKGSGAMPAEKI